MPSVFHPSSEKWSATRGSDREIDAPLGREMLLTHGEKRSTRTYEACAAEAELVEERELARQRGWRRPIRSAYSSKTVMVHHNEKDERVHRDSAKGKSP